jgi:hypothetical protein
MCTPLKKILSPTIAKDHQFSRGISQTLIHTQLRGCLYYSNNKKYLDIVSLLQMFFPNFLFSSIQFFSLFFPVLPASSDILLMTTTTNWNSIFLVSSHFTSKTNTNTVMSLKMDAAALIPLHDRLMNNR